MIKKKYEAMNLSNSWQVKVFIATQDLYFSESQTFVSCQITGTVAFVSICQPSIISLVLIS